MAHQCIKYRLTYSGTVPDFLYLGDDGVGGQFPVGDQSEPSPRDLLLIGISVNNPVGDFEIVPTQKDLEDYLSKAIPVNTDDPSFQFDPVASAAWVWERLTALNAK